MSKTTFTILVSSFIVALVGGVIWFFYFYQAGERQFDFGVTLQNYLPFGKLGETTQPPPGQGEINGAGGEEGGGVVVFGKLRQLAAQPIAGFTLTKATSTTVRYLERATGHIYDIGPAEAKARRISNTTIPRVYEAVFLDGGNSVLIRYLGDDNTTIETYGATVPKTEGGELKGLFLPQNIADLSASPDGKKFFYLTSFGGGAVGFTAAASGSSRQQVFTSLLTEWLSFWAGEKIITLTTKPSGGVPGYLYKLDPINKSFEKIFGGVPGLTTLSSPDGKFVFYSVSGETGLSSGLYDTKNKTVVAQSVATISDKCVWAKESDKLYCGVPEQLPQVKYPDTWYQGRVLFSDRLWSINPLNGDSDLIGELRTLSGRNIDVVKPALSSDGKYIFFVNKKDQSLWSLELGNSD